MQFIRHKSYISLVVIISLFSFALTMTGCSGTKITTNTKNLKKSKYFLILADADDDPIFVKLQDDLYIDPKMERYTVKVDIRLDQPQFQYVYIGDEYNPLKFQWSQVSIEVQNGLINWTGSNKENLE